MTLIWKRCCVNAECRYTKEQTNKNDDTSALHCYMKSVAHIEECTYTCGWPPQKQTNSNDHMTATENQLHI